jgi:hypothetical protein
MLKRVQVSVSPEDLVAIHKDRTGDEMLLKDARRILEKIQNELAQAMTSGGYEVIIDALTDYEMEQEEA